MTLALIGFVALALFAAMALVVMMVVGERSATESRLAALQAQYDPDVRPKLPKVSASGCIRCDNTASGSLS